MQRPLATWKKLMADYFFADINTNDGNLLVANEVIELPYDSRKKTFFLIQDVSIHLLEYDLGQGLIRRHTSPGLVGWANI
jgi:hypothetical protein